MKLIKCDICGKVILQGHKHFALSLSAPYEDTHEFDVCLACNTRLQNICKATEINVKLNEFQSLKESVLS